MEVAFSIAGIFGISMLLGGIVLTVITMARMRSGQISLPGWGKVLLCIGMIAMLLIMVVAILPPDVVEITNPFVETDVWIPDASVSAEIPLP